jgi:hypothetical protein
VNVVRGVPTVRAVGLAPSASIFVIGAVQIIPLWSQRGSSGQPENDSGPILLSLSIFGSVVFGLYHHFLAVSPDHVPVQPRSPWGLTFVMTAYLFITEAMGT